MISNKLPIDFNDNDKLLLSHKLKFAPTPNWTSFSLFYQNGIVTFNTYAELNGMIHAKGT